MMDKQRMMTLVAAVLTTALDTKPGEHFPESAAYLACGMNLSEWYDVRHVLIACGWVTIEGNVIRLTAEGEKVAKQIEAKLKEAKAR